MWDYEGKLESRGWSREQCLQILQARLLSPPGKMLRHFVQAVCDAILLESHTTAVHPPESDPRTSTKGFTSDIPFSPLKAKVTTRVTAAQTDFAEVDLTAWSSPLETEVEAHARVVLQRFAVRWWAIHLARDAMRWWRSNGREPRDLAAIEDCLFCAVLPLIGIGTEGLASSFGGSPKNSKRSCTTELPSTICLIHPWVTRTICQPPLGKLRSRLERKFSSFDLGISLKGVLLT